MPNDCKQRQQNKRRRTTTTPITSTGVAGIIDLTDDNLAAIADFLPKTSRALLAVALTASSSSWRKRGWKIEPSHASKAIIASVKTSSPFSTLIDGLFAEATSSARGDFWELRNDRRARCLTKTYCEVFKKDLETQLEEYYKVRWGVLDFVDIEESLASKLTDDDLGAILVCINAKKHLRTLKLTHCLSVVGHGLEPLMLSQVLEKIDMSLVPEFATPIIINQAVISEESVFPILDGIIGGGGSPFKRLQVPLEWCPGNPNEALVHFLGRHEHVLIRKTLCCYFNVEENCVKKLITIMTERCIECGFYSFGVCNDCNEIHCEDCNDTCVCCRCRIQHCRICDEKSDNPVGHCEGYNDCPDPLCVECRLVECRDGIRDCPDCKSFVFDKLVEKNNAQKEEMKVKQVEIDRLRQEVEKLQKDNTSQK